MPMTLTQLAKPQWQSFFERLSTLLRANVVEVEVSGLGLVDKIAADWVRLAVFAYNEDNDLLEISVHGADLAIHRPAQIHVRRDESLLQSIEIVDNEGNRTFVILKTPLSV